MIRVAHLLPTMEIGGRERIVADLCRTASGFGIDPVIVTYDRATAGAAMIDTPGTPTIELDRRHLAFRSQLGALLVRERIDVLHAQGHVSAALAAGLSATVPMLATMHIALGTGWRWLLPVVRGLRAADRLTAVSDDLARRYGQLTRKPISVIPTGVDLERFSPRATARDGDAVFTIGIAARLHPVKRHQDAIAALRLLGQRGMRCRLLIAGEGPCRERIAALAGGCEVELLGAITDMPSFLHGIDAFLLPSDHEGTPAALIEAMATGLPCIATCVGGVPALLGDAGMLVPRRDPSAIAAAIARLIGDDDLRTRLGRKAHARAQRHAMQHQAQRYADLYGELVRARVCVR